MGVSNKDKQDLAEGPLVLAPESYTRPEGPDGETRLLGNLCTKCGKVFFPARTLCPDCFEDGEMVPRELSGPGRIYSSTLVRIPAPVGIPAPYAYGYVELEESGVRVFALFTGAAPEWFRPGRKVNPVVGKVRLEKDGREVIGYKFEPAEEGQADE